MKKGDPVSFVRRGVRYDGIIDRFEGASAMVQIQRADSARPRHPVGTVVLVLRREMIGGPVK